MKKIKKGGKRKGAGRKPIKDKKIPLVIYVRPSIIKAHGGEENCKALFYGSLGITDF